MGILSFIDGGGDDKAQELNARMLREAQSIPLPILKKYYPELYQVVAQMNPESDTAVNLGPSEMQGIATDPALRQHQLSALDKLQGIGDAGGMDATFLAGANQLENDVNTNLQGQEGAISQNMATRGMSGGGSELVAKNISAQNASNRHANSALELKAQADQRALQALMSGGQMSGQMQAQDFSQQSEKAKATDAINKFNTQNSQNIQSQNVADRNNAQTVNMNNKQNISGQNTELKNNATLHNDGIAQQNYDNELKKRGVISGAAGSLAKSYQDEAQGNRQVIGGLVSAGGMAYGGRK